jgi:FlaA1/EpsC-like NDP-sugar epimerase
MRRVVAACEAAHVSFKTLPSLSDIIDGNISVSSIREVRIEDLLGRDIVDIDIESISRYLAGKRVMVVGAGGSIGSEICRQISKFGLESIILVGRGEDSIFNIHGELARAYPETYLPQVIADVSDYERARRVLERFEPQIIFHAGANKHVPLSELNCEEAIINNVLGTKNVLDEAERIGVERVVYISTDKAVYPVNVMGCTKRIAEMLVLRKKGSTTKVVGVRFGNVLGSRGSVVPVFKKQIAAGGPVTVTDPEMERYFMTIPEAARLVVQAGGIGEAGQLFVLDMGEPVKIVDLAREMIKLSGLEPEKDIRIKSIGIRPGERLSENLVGEGESLEPTAHAKIRAIVGSEIPDGDFEQRIAELERLARAGETKQAMAKLGAFAKGFDLSTVYLQQAESLRQERL